MGRGGGQIYLVLGGRVARGTGGPVGKSGGTTSCVGGGVEK